MAGSLGNSDELLKELDLQNYVSFVKRCFKNGIKKEEEDICAQDLRNLAKCLPRVSGVWYDLHKNSWEARWAEGTKSARKYYSVQKFGFHEARKLAIKTIKTKEINYIYNSINEDFNKPLKWNLNSEFLEMNHDPIINLKRKYRSPSCKVREKKIKKDPIHGNVVGRKNKGEKKSAAQTRGGEGHSDASHFLDGTPSKRRSDQGMGDPTSQHVVEGGLPNTLLNGKETSTSIEMALSTEGTPQPFVHFDEDNGKCLSEEDPLEKEDLCTVNEKGKNPSRTDSLNGHINGVNDYPSLPIRTPSDCLKMEESHSTKPGGDRAPKEGNTLHKHTLRKKNPNCNREVNGKEKTNVVKFPGSKILSYMRQHNKAKNKSALYVKQSGLLKMDLKQPPSKMLSREHGSGWNRKNLKKKNLVNEKRTGINGGALFVKKVKSCNHAEGKKCRGCDFRRRQLRGLRGHGSLFISSMLPNGGETSNGEEPPNVDLTDQLGTGEAFPTDGEVDARKGDEGGKQTGRQPGEQTVKQSGPLKEEAHMEGTKTEYPQTEYPQMEYPQMEYPQMEHPQMEHPQMEHPQTERTPVSAPRGEKAQQVKCCVEINLKEVIHSDTLSIFKNAINLLLNDLKCKCVPHLDKQFLNILEIIDNHISYVNSMLSEHILITYVHLFDICVSNNILPSQLDQNVQKVFCNALIAFHILLFNFLRDRRG
ncbi:hypothetical protein PVBG_00826 [Plasmodium vivax Brazil I]|uniref:AP2/ERF domain-containing protein n=1 Tax=Plasmodium vivax (strain Brazil I) TaxID=1033975 RepID=A0A0J9SLY8_PLAV1|nr:hypothetical protein PVBG_00826 [Plasmodium vivax Brazil I]